MAINPDLLVIKPVSQLESVTGLQAGELLFYDVNDPNTTLKKISIDTFNNLSKAAKPLKPTDPTPTDDGLYMPTESGTYSNADGLIAQDGYYTLFFKTGSTWTKSETLFPNDSDGYKGLEKPFDVKIKFDELLTKMDLTITNDVLFRAFDNDIFIGGSTLVRIVADGVHTPDFSHFKKMTGSQDYDNTNGVLNCAYFFYDGDDVWVNIWQGEGTSIIESEIPKTYTTVVFDELYGASYSSGVLTGGANSGGYQSELQNITNEFELILTDSTFVAVLGLMNSKDSNMIYGNSNNYIYGFYRNTSGYDVIKGPARTVIFSSSTLPNFFRVKRIGNDAVFSLSSDGNSWTDVFTDTNGFNSISTAYIKGVFVQSGNLKSIKYS